MANIFNWHTKEKLEAAEEQLRLRKDASEAYDLRVAAKLHKRVYGFLIAVILVLCAYLLLVSEGKLPKYKDTPEYKQNYKISN